ncbi:MAG TPA: TPM domain-containing protein [Candidatus Cybelea sp.]
MFATIAASWLALPAVAADFKAPPTPDHYVTDTAGALSSDTRGSIENELQAYEHATGHQVIVYIGETTGDVPLETWTGDSAHQWRIGRHGKDDGAILFLFMKDHKIRIEVGYGLESSLTDADSSRIINDIIRPKMRAGDTDGAVSGGVAAMLKTITPAYAAVTAPPAEEESSSPWWASGIAIGLFSMFAVFMLIVIYIIVMQIVGSIRYGYLVLREGAPAAKKQMKTWPTWGSGGGGSSSGGGSDDFGSGGDFDAGGGDFGGGGASGSW